MKSTFLSFVSIISLLFVSTWGISTLNFSLVSAQQTTGVSRLTNLVEAGAGELIISNISSKPTNNNPNEVPYDSDHYGPGINPPDDFVYIVSGHIASGDTAELELRNISLRVEDTKYVVVNELNTQTLDCLTPTICEFVPEVSALYPMIAIRNIPAGDFQYRIYMDIEDNFFYTDDESFTISATLISTPGPTLASHDFFSREFALQKREQGHGFILPPDGFTMAEHPVFIAGETYEFTMTNLFESFQSPQSFATILLNGAGVGTITAPSAAISPPITDTPPEIIGSDLEGSYDCSLPNGAYPLRATLNNGNRELEFSTGPGCILKMPFSITMGGPGTFSMWARNENTFDRKDYSFSVVNAAVCGNGTKEGTEQCDDNNTENDDGCSSLCQLESLVVSSEQSSSRRRMQRTSDVESEESVFASAPQCYTECTTYIPVDISADERYALDTQQGEIIFGSGGIFALTMPLPFLIGEITNAPSIAVTHKAAPNLPPDWTLTENISYFLKNRGDIPFLSQNMDLLKEVLQKNAQEARGSLAARNTQLELINLRDQIQNYLNQVESQKEHKYSIATFQEFQTLKKDCEETTQRLGEKHNRLQELDEMLKDDSSSISSNGITLTRGDLLILQNARDQVTNQYSSGNISAEETQLLLNEISANRLDEYRIPLGEEFTRLSEEIQQLETKLTICKERLAQLENQLNQSKNDPLQRTSPSIIRTEGLQTPPEQSQR